MVTFYSSEKHWGWRKIVKSQDFFVGGTIFPQKVFDDRPNICDFCLKRKGFFWRNPLWKAPKDQKDEILRHILVKNSSFFLKRSLVPFATKCKRFSFLYIDKICIFCHAKIEFFSKFNLWLKRFYPITITTSPSYKR